MRTGFHERFVVDGHGKRTAVILDVKEYSKLLRLLEEARALKIIREGEEEYRRGGIRPIRSLSELDKYQCIEKR